MLLQLVTVKLKLANMSKQHVLGKLRMENVSWTNTDPHATVSRDPALEATHRIPYKLHWVKNTVHNALSTLQKMGWDRQAANKLHDNNIQLPCIREENQGTEPNISYQFHPFKR